MKKEDIILLIFDPIYIHVQYDLEHLSSLIQYIYTCSTTLEHLSSLIQYIASLIPRMLIFLHTHKIEICREWPGNEAKI